MVVGGYTLDLYCDCQPFGLKCHRKGTYLGQIASECRRKARNDGWIIKGTQTFCPKCSGKKRKS